MDTPRRWQVASLATAVVSLGVGGALVARPAVDTVPSIDLDQVNATAALRPDLRPTPSVPADTPGPRIVVPPTPGDPANASTTSIDSPEEATTPPPPTVETEPDPAPATPVEPAPSPPQVDSPDSPDSVDSAASVDSA